MSSCGAEDIRRAVQELRGGRVLVIPTDTVYGLAADPGNAGAIEALFALKGRSFDKPIPLLVDSIETAQRCAAGWPGSADCLARAFWPGALTIVLACAEGTHELITAGTGSVGLRQPDHPVAVALLREFGGPLACTSANVSGKPPVCQLSDLPQSFLSADVFALDGGVLADTAASTVISVSDKSEARVLREGPITQDTVLKVLMDAGG